MRHLQISKLGRDYKFLHSSENLKKGMGTEKTEKRKGYGAWAGSRGVGPKATAFMTGSDLRTPGSLLWAGGGGFTAQGADRRGRGGKASKKNGAKIETILNDFGSLLGAFWAKVLPMDTPKAQN